MVVLDHCASSWLSFRQIIAHQWCQEPGHRWLWTCASLVWAYLTRWQRLPTVCLMSHKILKYPWPERWNLFLNSAQRPTIGSYRLWVHISHHFITHKQARQYMYRSKMIEIKPNEPNQLNQTANKALTKACNRHNAKIPVHLLSWPTFSFFFHRLHHRYPRQIMAGRPPVFESSI